MSVRPSLLYIVATPIGNLGDISARALDVLKEVDVIFAEDTRHSRRLLQHFGLQKTLKSLHEHNESDRIQQVVELLSEGASVALVSDAGTPLISDPGYRLVTHCLGQGLRICPVPGPSALIAALSVCGLPTNNFIFMGFPPARTTARQQWLNRLAAEPRTLVFYESRHRILASVEDMRDAFGAARIVTVARELTKAYETIKRATLAEILAWLNAHAEQQKGEFVLVVAGAVAQDLAKMNPEIVRVLHILLEEMSVKQAASLAAKITGCKRKQAYALALSLRDAD